MIQISEEQLAEVKAYLAEVPFKYAFPLLQFLEKLQQEQNQNQETTQN